MENTQSVLAATDASLAYWLITEVRANCRVRIDACSAAEVIAVGQPREVHVATINDQIYLNNIYLLDTLLDNIVKEK